MTVLQNWVRADRYVKSPFHRSTYQNAKRNASTTAPPAKKASPGGRIVATADWADPAALAAVSVATSVACAGDAARGRPVGEVARVRRRPAGAPALDRRPEERPDAPAEQPLDEQTGDRERAHAAQQARQRAPDAGGLLFAAGTDDQWLVRGRVDVHLPALLRVGRVDDDRRRRRFLSFWRWYWAFWSEVSTRSASSPGGAGVSLSSASSFRAVPAESAASTSSASSLSTPITRGSASGAAGSLEGRSDMVKWHVLLRY